MTFAGKASALALSVSVLLGWQEPEKPQPKEAKKEWLPGEWGKKKFGLGEPGAETYRTARRQISTHVYVTAPENADVEKLLERVSNDRSLQADDVAQIYQSILENGPGHMVRASERTTVNARVFLEDRLIGVDAPLREAYRALGAPAVGESIERREDERVALMADRYAITKEGERLLAAAGLLAMERGKFLEAFQHFSRLVRFYPAGRCAPVAVAGMASCADLLASPILIQETTGCLSRMTPGSIAVNTEKISIGDRVDALLTEAAKESLYPSLQHFFFPHAGKPVFERRLWSRTWAVGEGAKIEIKEKRGAIVDIPHLTPTLAVVDDYYASLNTFHKAVLPIVDGDGLRFPVATATASLNLADGAPGNEPAGSAATMELGPAGAEFQRKIRERGEILMSNVAGGGATIYFCCRGLNANKDFYEYRLHAADGRDGTVRWSHVLFSIPVGAWGVSGWVMPSALRITAGSSVFVSSGFGFVFAVDATTGRPEWFTSYPSTSDENMKVEMSVDRTNAGKRKKDFILRNPPPLVYGGTLIVHPRDHDGVMAFDTRTGEPKWEYPAPKQDLVLMEGIVDGKLILSKKGVLALDVETGRELWRWENNEIHRWGKGALTRETLYLPAWEGVHAIRLADGRAERVHPWERPEEEAGTLILLGDRTISVGLTGIVCYGSKER